MRQVGERERERGESERERRERKREEREKKGEEQYRARRRKRARDTRGRAAQCASKQMHTTVGRRARPATTHAEVRKAAESARANAVPAEVKALEGPLAPRRAEISERDIDDLILSNKRIDSKQKNR